MNDSRQIIDISTSAILRVVLILLGLFFLFFIRDIILIIFVSIVIASAASGPVNWLSKKRVPRILGVIFVYLLLFLLIALMIFLVFPPLSDQIKQLAGNFPRIVDNFTNSFSNFWQNYHFEANFQNILNEFGNRLSGAASSFFSTIVGIFGGLFSAAAILIISFYLTLQEKGIKKFFLSITPSDHQQYISDLIERIEIKIGGWLRGQLLIMLVVGILTYIGLVILGVKYALILALIIGILEIVPFLGPILAAIPAVIISFSQSPLLALLVIILYIIVQQLENYVIYPQIMKKTVGLSPLVIIIVMMIGAKLAGILGIILAVPVTASVVEFLKDMQK